MKHILISTISIIVFFSFEIGNYKGLSEGKPKSAAGCPVYNTQSGFYLLQALTSNSFAEDRDLSGLAKVDTSGLKSIPLNSGTPRHLQDFWKSKGVQTVSESAICTALSEIVDNRSLSKEVPYFLAFFETPDRYVILHITEDMMTKVPKTVIILDKDFKHVHDFLIRK